MKPKFFIYTVTLFILAFATGCEDNDSSQTGMLSLSITDAPIDQDNVSGVYITVNGLEYHKQNNDWATFKEFDGPKTFNLMELTDSVSAILGSFEMDAGQYNQIRLTLNAPIRGEGTPSNPGCYLEFDGGTTEPLYVPSAEQSGFKLVHAFKVPSNGTVELTADFDARKSIVESGSGDLYILKPTVRLIADNEAGSISGGITGLPTDGSEIVVYAYEDGTYSDQEAADPEVETSRFPNAITSDKVGDKDSYHLYYLAPMTYDLVLAQTLDGQFQGVVKVVQDVVVESRKNTNRPITLDLSSQ